MAFSPIRTWTDAQPYAGSVVAYQSDSSYFGPDQGLRLEHVQFGYVSEMSSLWHEKDNGYLLSKLLRMDEDVSSMHELTDPILRESNLSMRSATDAETKSIKSYVAADLAYFEFITNKSKMLKILARQLGVTPARQ